MIWTHECYTICDDRSSINVDAVFELLNACHWAKHRSVQTIALTIENSLCFGLFAEDIQIGFARVLTDYATYAVILDMIVKERYRGKGLGKWLMNVITCHPSIQTIRQILWTSNASAFYAQFGFSQVQDKPLVLVKPPF